MADAFKQEIKLFYCYAHEDKLLRDELEKHLGWLRRRYQLTNWYDREILPGEEWEQAIDMHLNTANLILLLISSDFMNSDYCYGKEMRRALERHKEGTCRVIPILLRPTYWEGAPFSSLQLLPTDARPITRWPDRDEAFQDVVTEISRTIKDLLISLKTKEEWLKEDATVYGLKRYQEALAACEQAIRLDPNDAAAYHNKGFALYGLKRYQEALAAFEQAIRLDSNFALAYYNKGLVLNKLKRYKEAIAAYEQAIRLDSNFALAYYNKGNALSDLKRYEEALAAYEQAIRLDPNYASAYNHKGNALSELKRYEEALAAYEQAIRLNPNHTLAYSNKGHALSGLKRYEEALAACSQAIRSTTFAKRYVSGVCWRLFGWREHGEIEAQGPLPEHYLIDNLKMCAKLNRFGGDHDEPLRADSGFFLGMVYGGVLTPDGTLRPDARTLVIIHTKDFREGYARGRCDYFTRYEEIAHTEDELLDLLKARAQDHLYLGREQNTLRWAIGCTVGELSGRLFPLTQQEQPHQHPTTQVKRMTVLQEA